MAAAPSSAHDLDEKGLASFTVDDAINLDWGGSSGPPSSILQAPSSGSPANASSSLSASSSSRQQPPALRSSNYRAFQSSSALNSGSAGSGSGTSSTSTRKLPEISLDLSSSAPPGSSPVSATSSSSGHFGASVGGVSLPSPSSASSQHSEPKKKPFLMASLAIGLNEVISTNDDDDDDGGGGGDDTSLQSKQTSSPSGRSPKKFQLGLPQKSPSYALASSPKSTSPTGGNGSKLLPIGGGMNSHTFLKFDPIVSGGSSKCIDLETADKALHQHAADPPSSYRKTIASRSPLRDRSILGSPGESDFMGGSTPLKPAAQAPGSSGSSLPPSKLDPLDTESIRGSSLAPSGTSIRPERKSIKLSSSSSSPEKARPPDQQPLKQETKASSPEKPAAQPKFRNPFKKNTTATPGALAGDKSQEASGAMTPDDDIDLLGDTHRSSLAQAPLTPMDEFNYLSFSPRPGGSGKQPVRDLPSLSLSSDAKDSASSSSSSKQSPASPTQKKPKKPKEKAQAQDQDHTAK